MSDELPTSPLENESGIVNLQTSGQPGSHWVAYRKVGSDVTYFDSFGGVPPPRRLASYFRGCRVTYNQRAHQRPNQETCGPLCVLFLRGLLPE